GPMDLSVRHLVVSVPGRPASPAPAPEPVPVNAVPGRGAIPLPPREPDPVVYWDAKLTLAGATFDTGQPWADVFGSMGCVGRYEGAFLGPVIGTVWFDRATVADQPLARLKVSFATDPQRPDPTKPGAYEPVAVRFTDA